MQRLSQADAPRQIGVRSAMFRDTRSQAGLAGGSHAGDVFVRGTSTGTRLMRAKAVYFGREPSVQSQADRPSKVVAPLRLVPKPPRILHISFSSQIAGSERYCIDLANRQAALGHEVHVAGVPGSPLAAGLAKGVLFHPIGRLFRKARLQRLIDAEAIDVCHAHLSPACKAVSRLQKGDVKRVATLHVGYKARQHERLDGVICVNNAQAQRIAGFDGQAQVISNWLPATGDQTADPRLRAELRLPADALLIGAVGRLHRSKGYDVLISAFRAVAPANAALVIIGEGPHRKALEKLRGGDPRIHLPGFRKDVAGFLRSLDLFVSPSREESFGLAILEAMQAGLPIVATQTEGPSEHLRDQPITFAKPGCVDSLTDALGRAITKRGGVAYDLSPFRPAVGVSKIMAFYAHLDQPDEALDLTDVFPDKRAYA